MKTATATITFQQVLERIQRLRPCSARNLFRLFKKLNITPEGTVKSYPLKYSPDTPDRILDALGEKVVTMQQLRAVKRQAQKARAA